MLRGLAVIFGVTLPWLASAAEPAWEHQALDAEFRAEGVAVGDFNKDGKRDVAAGDVWYAAPDWKQHEVRPVGKYDGTKGYSQCFASWAWDINHDGWDDLIIVGFPGEPFHWYENPQGKPGHWKKHEIWHSICNETPYFADLTGDGQPEVLLGSQPERQIGFLQLPSVEKCTEKWAFHAISEAGDPATNGTFKYYHGLGMGDVNADGRLDVVIPHGWWEAPEDRTSGLWAYHPNPLIAPGQKEPVKASDIHVLDLDGDGDNDIITSSAHAFGVWWFENPGANSEEPFKGHLIDDTFSQTHASFLGKLYGDDTPVLLTGKRYFAHQGADPGGRDPVIMVTYKIERTAGQPPKFIRQEIEAGQNTGVGTQFTVTDLDGNGTLDAILSNKKGVHLLLQK